LAVRPGRNDGRARHWFLKAARQGHRGAQESLAVMYAKGQGVRVDPRRARFWKRKAAAQKQE